MPRYKPARGNVTIRTVFPEEFSRWLNYELYNSYQWNTDSMKNSNPHQQQYECCNKNGETLWRIVIRPHGDVNQGVTFISNQPVIWIRKGLQMRMGSEQLIVG